MDNLYRAAGIKVETEDGAGSEAAEILVSTAKDFLEAGGVLSLAEFALLSSSSRAAFITAGRLLAIKRAASFGFALSGPEGAAELMREIDEGESAIRLALEQAADRVAKKHLNAGTPAKR